MSKDIIICRCNDVTHTDIISVIKEGFTSLEEIKRILRVGMGPCQGRTCIPLIVRILSTKTERTEKDISLPKIRPPIKPTKFYLFTQENNYER